MATGETAGPRRRPDSGGYARGEETRARIIAAALDVFGAEGYERASTRQIARDAGVNPPALQYYFDSKEGLHRACAQFIIESVGSTLLQAVAETETIAAANDPHKALDALCDLLDTLLDTSLASKEVPAWSRFMAGAQADAAAPAAHYIRDEVTRPVQLACSRLVGVVIGLPFEAQETRLRAALVLGQLSAFHLHRHNTLCLLDWPDFAGERGAVVKAQLRTHTRAALGHATVSGTSAK